MSRRVCTASEVFFLREDEPRGFLAELATPTHGQVLLAALMVREWKSIAV